nr:ROK family protein [Streptomyces chrestomyceticus]
MLAAADEPATAALLAETAEYLGAGIADLVNLFNPERIVVAGWAGLLLAPRLLPSVRAAAAAYALRHPFERTVIEPGRLGPEAVTVGPRPCRWAGSWRSAGTGTYPRERIVSGPR